GPEALRAGGGAGNRLPLRRPVRRGRHRPPVADEPAGPASLEAVVLVRPGAAGGLPQGVERQAGERGGRPARLLPPCQDERRRHPGQVDRAAGEGGVARTPVTPEADALTTKLSWPHEP